MKPVRTLLLGAALVAGVAFGFSSSLFAEDGAPAAPTATPAHAATPAPAVEAPKPAEVAKPETKTPSPMHSLMGWVAKQVAPTLECACPSTPEGAKAWRTWFEGGKDVPLASLRDALVADGWNADRTIGFFQEMASKMKASGDGAGKCEGKCDGAGKGECAGMCDCAGMGDCAGMCDGAGKGDCAGKCGGAKKPDAPAVPTEAPKLP